MFRNPVVSTRWSSLSRPRVATRWRVIDLTPPEETDRTAPVDQHDPPETTREAAILRDATCVFPGCRRDDSLLLRRGGAGCRAWRQETLILPVASLLETLKTTFPALETVRVTESGLPSTASPTSV